ncbi:hypothetical protein [Endothiovibrio diazotrophicus]
MVRLLVKMLAVCVMFVYGTEAFGEYRFVIPFYKNNEKVRSGFLVRNVSDQSITFDMKIYRGDGQVIWRNDGDDAERELGVGGEITYIPDGSETQTVADSGWIDVRTSAAGSIAVMGLGLAGSSLFALPAVTDSASWKTNWVIPHFQTGNGFKSEMCFCNPEDFGRQYSVYLKYSDIDDRVVTHSLTVDVEAKGAECVDINEQIGASVTGWGSVSALWSYNGLLPERPGFPPGIVFFYNQGQSIGVPFLPQ